MKNRSNNNFRARKDIVKEQPKKDSKSGRVNFDNTRKSKFIKDVEKEIKKDSHCKGANDVSWYSNNATMLQAAGSIPFASVLGTKLGFGGANGTNTRVPGIMGIVWTPQLGPRSDDYNAINQAAASMYSFLVHANSRNYSYEQSDLMMLVLAGSDLFSTIAHVIRAYGVACTYSEQNKYLPDTLLAVMGFDPQDFRNNLAQIWFDINQLIAQTQQIWIPNTLPLIQRRFWMNSNIFKDDNDPKGQIYLFLPTNTYSYIETLTDNGGGIVSDGAIRGNDACGCGSSRPANTWVAWRTRIQEMIDALVNSEDRGIIFGDILNAYGKDKIYALPPIPSDYRIEAIYNAEVLTQIENLTVCPSTVSGFQQINNRISPMYYDQTSRTSEWTPYQPIINFHHEAQPTPGEVMVATRLTCAGAEYIAGPTIKEDPNAPGTYLISEGNTLQPLSCGSEYVTEVFIVDAPYGTNGYAKRHLSLSFVAANQGVISYSVAHRLLETMSFDWHPFAYDITLPATSETQGAEVNYAYGDYANYTVINGLMLNKLHTTAMYSLCGVPQI